MNILLSLFYLAVLFPLAAHAAPADLVFTEVMYNPEGADTQREWVELYNRSAEPVIIIEGVGEGSWRFNDGSNHTLTLVQGSLTIPGRGYAILASDGETFLNEYPDVIGTVIDTVMSLNNTSDTIMLSDDKGEHFFEMFTYENSWGADGDGNTLEKIDYTAGNSSANWQASSIAGGTPGAVSSPYADTPPQESDNEEENVPPDAPPETETHTTSSPQIADPAQVRISELFPNPETDESLNEFIELWNNNTYSISLDGWKLSDASKVIVLSDITLVPGEYRALYRSETKLTLNNDRDIISLFDASGNLINRSEYSASYEGQSLAYQKNTDSFEWSTTPTPNRANEITAFNSAPTAHIAFLHNPVAPGELVRISAADSFDAENDPLHYLWKIGEHFEANGETFTYAFPSTGTALVTLLLGDAQHMVLATKTIEVLPWPDVLSQRTYNAAAIANAPLPSQSIAISEIFPNPAGQDTNEWVELYNASDEEISLEGWVLDDAEGGSKPFIIHDVSIEPYGYLVLEKEDTKIILNNTSDSVRIFDQSNSLVDGITYDHAIEDQSYAKIGESNWAWTSERTPGDANEGGGERSNTEANLPFSSFSQNAYQEAYENNEGLIDIDLENVRELEPGTHVRLQGTVAVEPGVLAKTYFYLTGSPGIQVYFARREWPELHTGDVVGVIGTLSQANNELRIKVADKTDIVPLYQAHAPAPIEIETGDVSESFEGALVQVQGELLEKRGNSWYIDDGSGEVRVVFQQSAQIQKPQTSVGDWVSVAGLVSETQSGYRVLPRYQDDIRRLAADEIDQGGSVRGATSEASTYTIAKNNKQQTILIYLLITTAALVILMSGLLVKAKLETKKRLAALEKRIKR